MSDIQSVDQALSEAAKSGVEYASQTFGVTLDYSEASIEEVEGILSKIYDSIPRGFLSKLTKKAPTPKELDRIGFMFGGYIAEVIKRHFGGRWKMESSLHPGQKVLTFEATGGGELWPQIKVGKRLQNGPEDNVWHYYQALRERFQKKT
ncbi:MAG: hypothetical protein WAO21_02060 [Verrucomicrobiia bacterium]